MLKSHKSRPYNPNIAQTFFRVGFIEAWGSGIERIKAACEAENAEFPDFQKSGNDLTVIFNMKQTEKYSVNNSGINNGINDEKAAIIVLMRDNPTITISKRLYIKRGYIPDGSGVWYGRSPARQYEMVENGDNLVLYMSKRLF